MIGGFWIWQLRGSVWRGRCGFHFVLVIYHFPWWTLEFHIVLLYYFFLLFLPEPKKQTKVRKTFPLWSQMSYAIVSTRSLFPCSHVILWEFRNRSQKKELVRPEWSQYHGNFGSGAMIPRFFGFFPVHFPPNRPIDCLNTIFGASTGRWLDEPVENPPNWTKCHRKA